MTDNQHIFLNSIAYIANRCQNRTIDFHKLCKILYFAEQKHLVKYGSNLIDDTFIAMSNGPVPSELYDMLKGLRYRPSIMPIELRQSLTINQWFITSLIEPDMDWLSESEVACMNESIEENQNLSFTQLSDKSHDSAWKSSFYMKTDEIAKAGGANDDIITYINSHSEKISY